MNPPGATNVKEELEIHVKLEPGEEETNEEEQTNEEPSNAPDVGDDDADVEDEEPEVRIKIEPDEGDNVDDEERADDEEEDDEDDHVKVTIDDELPDYNLRAKQRQPQQAKPVAAIDLDAQQPILDVDINTLEDKPWRKPGADISDYFNYGFDEDTWKLYCEKQKKMKSIVNELNCSNSETTFKIPVLPTNDHSKYSPVRMIPTHVSNESRFNSWIPPTISGSSQEAEQDQPNHDRLGDMDVNVRGHADMLNLRDRDSMRPIVTHQRNDHSLERMRDRDRKHDRHDERDREVVERERHRDRERERERERESERDSRDERHEQEPRSDLRHRLDRVKEDRHHVESEHRSRSKHHHRSEKETDRLDAKHSSERKERERSDKVRGDRERSHRTATSTSRKRERSREKSSSGSDKRRKNR